MKNHWRDEKTGEYRFIPIGDLSDLHHGTPYRIFNASREIEAHHYLVGGLRIPKFEAPWSDIQQWAAKMSRSDHPSE